MEHQLNIAGNAMNGPPGFEKLVEEFSRMRPKYLEYGQRVCALFRSLLQSQSIQIHTLEQRAKTVESFREKLARPGKTYSAVAEVPDLCGIRLIVYYPDDVNKAESLVRSEFEVDEQQSGNTANRLATNEFGYLSLHLIVGISSSRVKLPEWKAFQGFRAEIQVRTVLQHAWAAISHALQYKRESEVPNSLRRRLFRLAGLMELADEEFASLNAAHQRLAEEMTGVSPANFAKQPINRFSVKEFLDRSKLPKRIEEIGFSAGFKDAASLGNITALSIPDIIVLCGMADIKTIGEFERALLGVLPKGKEFFKMLIRDREAENWYADLFFFINLLLILAYPERFKVNVLVTALDWGERLAELTVRNAQEICKETPGI